MRFDPRDLGAWQGELLAVITAPHAPSEPALKIHHDTWLLGLIDALGETCPLTAEALGDQSFKAFARDYVYSHPLTRGDRNGYGQGFADMLEAHPHLPVPWLPDLVRYEQALHHAHGARDAEPCGLDELLSPEARVALHPSVRLLSLTHDVRAVAAGDCSIPAITCDLLIARNRDDEVVQLSLTPLERDFLTFIESSGALMTVIERLAPNVDDMALLQSLLARLVQHGLLILIQGQPT